MSEFSKMVKAFQKGAGGIGKTFTGSENLQNITAGVAPTPNLNYNITQFKPSLPGLNPALKGTPNLPSLNLPSPNWETMTPNLPEFNTDFGTVNFDQDWLPKGGFEGGTLGTVLSALKGAADQYYGMDQKSGVGLLLKGMGQTGGELNKFLFGGNIQKYGEHWKRQMIGNEEDVWSDNTTTTTTTDDGGTVTDDGGTVTSGPGEAPDTSEEAAALMSGAAKPGAMSERDRLARIRRMLAGRYGRAETQLTKGGFGEGTGRSLTGYA